MTSINKPLFALAVLCILVQGGCSPTRKSIEGKLLSTIQERCKSVSPCVIRMSEVTDSVWDRMYVFDYTMDRRAIEKRIGATLHKYEELHTTIILMQGNTVSYSESDTIDPERLKNNQVVFEDIPPQSHFVEYDRQVTFTVSKHELPDGSYFGLSASK